MSESAAVRRPIEMAGIMSRSWRASPSQLAAIRAELHGWLSPLGLTADGAQDVVLAVNEAVSNVIDHAYPAATVDDTVDVTLRAERDILHIEVVDHGRWRPPSTEPGRRGWGITLMNRLMAAVFIRYDSRGTRVIMHYPRT